MKAAELTGKTFGYLTVVARQGSRNNKAMWLCKCKCGNEVLVPTGDLNQGKVKSCGCKHHDNGKEKVVDETGKRYGRLLVIEQAESNIERSAMWKCRCDCGNEVVVKGKSLRQGKTKSCGCLIADTLSKRSLHDLTGMRFGILTVIKRAPTRYSDSGNMATRWLCKCDCGNETIVYANALTTNGHTRSCGCMKTSFREKLIDETLRHLHVRYAREYTFDDLLSPSGKKLRFDFAFFDGSGQLIGLLEHQGEQHYMPANNGFGQMQREITDSAKKNYCKEHGIPLFEIAYDDDIIACLRKILSQMNASYVNSVPSAD